MLTFCMNYIIEMTLPIDDSHEIIGSIPGRGERNFPLSSVSRPALGPTQPPVQWVPGVLSPGVKRGRGATLTTHPHLVPRSRMSTSYAFSPPSAFVSCSGTALAFRLPRDNALRCWTFGWPQVWPLGILERVPNCVLRLN
jgi:hypothetical protein